MIVVALAAAVKVVVVKVALVVAVRKLHRKKSNLTSALFTLTA
jgi:hypothetical protein